MAVFRGRGNIIITSINIGEAITSPRRELSMEYRSAIVDEMGDVVCWCSDMSRDEQMDILDAHPEYSIRCIEIW